MRRKPMLVLLALLAVGFAAVALISARKPLVLYGDPWDMTQRFLGLRQSQLILRYPRTGAPGSNWDTSFPGFTYRVRSAWPGTQTVAWGLSLWWPCFLLVLPLGVGFLSGPVRRVRRHSRRQCPRCAYHLRGNTTGVCPECGEDVVAWMLPRWERILISVLCALITAWLVEFAYEQTAFPHRFTIWLVARIGIDVGTWVLPSLLRAGLISGMTIAMYVYLSPERFGETDKAEEGAHAPRRSTP